MRIPSVNQTPLPGRKGSYLLELAPPVLEKGQARLVHFSWSDGGKHYVLRDFLGAGWRKEGADLNSQQIWRSATKRIPCHGKYRHSVRDANFWIETLKSLSFDFKEN